MSNASNEASGGDIPLDTNAKAATSESDLKQIVDTIPMLVWSAGSDGQAEFFNKPWLQYTGLSPEQAQGWGWADAIYPEDLKGLVEYWQECLASGTPVEVEARMRRFDGTYRWFLFRANPLRDEIGNIIKWYGTNTDIEDRKQADESMRKSELNLRQMTETIPEMLWSATPEGDIDYVNSRFLKYTGLLAHEIMANGWQKTIHPDDAARVYPIWMSCIKNGATYHVEVRTFHAPDHTYRWCVVDALPLLDSQRNILKWYGTIIDVHDRKRVEDELRRSEEFLIEAQRLSSTGSYFWDLINDEIIWSEEARRIYGFDQEERVTRDLIMSRVHPDDRDKLTDVIEQALATKHGVEHQYRLQMPDQSIRYVHSVAHARLGEHDQLEFIGAIHDLTESQLAAEALEKARTDLAHVVKVSSLGALTASIAHEVNQPLSGIITNASTCLRMLAADPPNLEGARKTAKRTIRDGNRASEVVTRLRGLFTKSTSSEEPLNLNEAAQEVIILTNNELQKNKIIVRSTFAVNLPIVKGDRVQLQQVILNLLLNAADAMKDIEGRTRQLLIETLHDDTQGHVQLAVQDAGTGIEPHVTENIFEPFYTTKSGGMGIGLFVSRSIIEKHNGRLWVSQNNDTGATFSFSIPCS